MKSSSSLPPLDPQRLRLHAENLKLARLPFWDWDTINLLNEAAAEVERLREECINQRLIGHGDGQTHAIADVNAGRVDHLIAERLRARSVVGPLHPRHPYDVEGSEYFPESCAHERSTVICRECALIGIRRLAAAGLSDVPQQAPKPSDVTPQVLKDAAEIRSSYGFLLMRLAVAKDLDDVFNVCKREFFEHEAAHLRLGVAVGQEHPSAAAAPAKEQE